MSLSTIESDYTPKDFLQKLLGNKFKSQKTSQDLPRHDEFIGNSQSQCPNIRHNQTDFKTIITKRIHFQSIQNIRSPRKILTEIHFDQQNYLQGSKSNQSKDTVKKQRSAFNHQRINLNEKVINVAAENNELVNGKQKQAVKKTVQFDIQNIKSQGQQNLAIQKVLLLLKATLNTKFPNDSIQNVVSKIQKGMRNSSEFDEIILQSQRNLHCATKQGQIKKECQLKIRCERSKSILVKRSQQNLSIRRYRSQNKIILLAKTKKEVKNEMIAVKKEILSTIKRMKQLFFLNEKSLKATKRAPSF